MERGHGVGRITSDRADWSARRGRDDGSHPCLVGKVRFDCVTSNEIAQLKNNARIADALIAVEQIHLLS